MEALENLMDKVVDEILRPEEITFRLIESKINAMGINLTRKQILQLKNQLSQDVIKSTHIDLIWWQKRKIEKYPDDEIVLDLGIVEIEPLEKDIQQAIHEATQYVLAEISETLLKNWKSQSSSLLKKQQKERANHAKVINDIWGKPLDLFEILLSVSYQAGSDFNEYFRPIAVEENDFVFEVHTRLHARGCQVGLEALLLLRNGFADGAHARWRTLHEICVEALYISQNGKSIVEKYLLHSKISNYRIASEYQKYYAKIGYAQPNQDEMEALENQRNELLNRYGKNYKHDYGWASISASDKPPTFAELEKSVGLEHMRPFYKLANVNVHSGSKGASFRLGLPPNDSDILMTGSSIYGLGEPGQNLAYSFFLLTSALLLSRENLDQLTFVSTIKQLMDETIWAFDEVMAFEENTSATD